MTISEINEMLRSNVCEVIFTKKDGTKRILEGTLIGATGDSTSVPSHDIVTLWDTENNGWRSFRMDRLVNIRALSSAG